MARMTSMTSTTKSTASTRSRVGPLPQLDQRPLGGGVAGEQEVDGPPHHAHEGEHGVAGGGRDGDELLGGAQAFVGEVGPEDDVVQQRQGLGERLRVVEGAGGGDGRVHERRGRRVRPA